MLSTQCKTGKNRSGEHYGIFSSQPEQTYFSLGYLRNEVNSSDQQLIENLSKIAKRCKSGKGQKITAALYNNCYRGESRGKGGWKYEINQSNFYSQEKTSQEINAKHI